jgi:hypothetical protein
VSRSFTYLLVAASLGGAVAMAAPSSATTNPGPVYVGTDNGGVQFGASIGSSPLVGGKADSTGVCVGVGYQVPQCPIGTDR